MQRDETKLEMVQLHMDVSTSRVGITLSKRFKTSGLKPAGVRNKSLIGAATLFSTRIAMGKEYPFSEATLGGKLAAGTGLSVHCFGCQRRAVLDVAKLVKRFGPDQRCLHWDLLKIIFCSECRGAGGDDRNLQFTNHALTPEQRNRWTPCP